MEELAKEILFLKYGIGAACVLGTIFILVKVAMWVYDFKQKQTAKEKADEELRRTELEASIRSAIISVDKLAEEIKTLHKEVAILPKILKDLEKLFFVEKETLGDEEWNKMMLKFKKEKELNS